MIYKRHLFIFGARGKPIFHSGAKNAEKSLSMGEDEQWEAISRDSGTPRTWWRKWLKIK